MELDRDDIPDSDADYLIQIPRAVLANSFRCMRCRQGTTAHADISDCIAATITLVDTAARQGYGFTVCKHCGGPRVTSRRKVGQTLCLRCGYRPRSPSWTAKRTCIDCGTLLTAVRAAQGTRCKACTKTYKAAERVEARKRRVRRERERAEKSRNA
jgi:hypothetical protein